MNKFAQFGILALVVAQASAFAGPAESDEVICHGKKNGMEYKVAIGFVASKPDGVQTWAVVQNGTALKSETPMVEGELAAVTPQANSWNEKGQAAKERFVAKYLEQNYVQVGKLMTPPNLEYQITFQTGKTASTASKATLTIVAMDDESPEVTETKVKLTCSRE